MTKFNVQTILIPVLFGVIFQLVASQNNTNVSSTITTTSLNGTANGTSTVLTSTASVTTGNTSVQTSSVSTYATTIKATRTSTTSTSTPDATTGEPTKRTDSVTTTAPITEPPPNFAKNLTEVKDTCGEGFELKFEECTNKEKCCQGIGKTNVTVILGDCSKKYKNRENVHVLNEQCGITDITEGCKCSGTALTSGLLVIFISLSVYFY